ncbi:indole-3-glycerol phosphate synthase TrpC [Streptomyces catenulae]|uniref:Indole-3-glycerol phosphate synthase n=1 Tax=Streptomyces catenulae TaxID=66875 RepID=A0ABV2Z3S6_9ACTN|nr:indole-3-glycerol phosphate synthase TrpC [Streptomyces catenulae]
MSVLDEIVEGVRADLAVRRKRVPEAVLRERAAAAGPPVDCVELLRAGPGPALIAEVKRASPSKGALARIGAPADLAAEYTAGGAAAVSVLTEQRCFGGSLDDLDAVRARVTAPVLRKDFVVGAYQLWEARAHGADLALLMVSVLAQPLLADLVALATEIGLTPLVEAHDEAEAERAVAAGARVVGINARNLRTLEVHRQTFARVAPHLPDGIVKVAESGVRGPFDVAGYATSGADAVLVGEALVRSPDPRATVAAFLAASRPAVVGG